MYIFANKNILNNKYNQNFNGCNKKTKLIAKRQIAHWQYHINTTEKNLKYFKEYNSVFIYKMNFFKNIFSNIFNKNKILIPKMIKPNKEKFIRDFSNLKIEYDNELLLLPEFSLKLDLEKDIEKKKNGYCLLNDRKGNISEDFNRIIKYRNEFAKINGYKNYYDYSKQNKKCDYKLIDEIINDILKNKEFINTLEKRDDILSEYYNISKDKLEKHHKQINLLSILDINKYFKNKEDFYKITKNLYESMGFDISSYEKNKNLILDLYPRENKTNGGFCLPIIFGKQCRILTNITGRIRDLSTLLHEFGHAMYNLNVNKYLSLNKPPNVLITEAVAMMMENIIYKENFLSDVLPKDILEKVKEYNQIDKIYLLSNIISFVEFEKQMYENTEIELPILWKNIREKVNLPSLDNDYDYIIPHYVNSEFYYNNYLLGILLAEQMYKTLVNKVGGDLTKTKKTSEVLNKKLFKYGGLLGNNTIIKLFTGEKINPKYIFEV